MTILSSMPSFAIYAHKLYAALFALDKTVARVKVNIKGTTYSCHACFMLPLIITSWKHIQGDL